MLENADNHPLSRLKHIVFAAGAVVATGFENSTAFMCDDTEGY